MHCPLSSSRSPWSLGHTHDRYPATYRNYTAVAALVYRRESVSVISTRAASADAAAAAAAVVEGMRIQLQTTTLHDIFLSSPNSIPQRNQGREGGITM